MTARRDLGDFGERIAAHRLESEGMTVIERNVRVGRIEIDLVMPYDYTLEHLYQLERQILERLHEKFPTAVPRVYVTPCDRNCIRDGVTHCPIKLAAGRS